ncbi:FAD-binding protein [Kozakia baliensis]|uniref:FAD-dependent oxidoreductase n=1 Tax=Kozakia baliensis TaxID=153496 RepID=UPI00345C0FF5
MTTQGGFATEHCYTADILVIGGGLAGCWAALTAARSGAKTRLLEKGYCGTSGVAAAGGPGHWWIPPLPGARENAVTERLRMAAGLGDASWMHRIIDRTWRTLPDIAAYYDYTPDDEGRIRINALRGPEYLRALRDFCIAAGVRIVDHSPVLGLLRGTHGDVVGAYGVHRQAPGGVWEARARATILATGGCAFRSRLLGAMNNTGDGHLMAAELGASFSGMEFSSVFTVAPARTTMTRTMIYSFATYMDANGHEISRPTVPDGNVGLALALERGPVWCDLSHTPEDIRRQLPQISPNVMLPFRRLGIDPFSERFRIDLIGEGTIRGVGGLHVAGEACESEVTGLFIVGDVASRENVTGPISGGGAVNAAWALTSGCLAAEGALDYFPTGHTKNAERVGTQPASEPLRRQDAWSTAEDVVCAEMLDAAHQLLRREANLLRSQGALDAAWQETRDASVPPDPHSWQRTRETQATLAVARWCIASASCRQESLGMHKRADAPDTSAPPPYRVRTGGIDEIWTRKEIMTV